MPTDTNVNSLVINKLTKAQYDAIQNPSETELYLVEESIDTTPTSGSDNLVTSGGVYSALQGKADSSSLATVATSGSYNDLSNKPAIPTVPNNVSCYSNDTGDGIIPSDGIRAETVTSGATMSINPDVVTLIDGNVGTSAITLQVPNDNLAHVWDILMTTGATPAVTIALSNSETILYPDGFSIGASKAVEISVIGKGTTYYLRYGEFA